MMTYGFCLMWLWVMYRTLEYLPQVVSCEFCTTWMDVSLLIFVVQLAVKVHRRGL